MTQISQDSTSIDEKSLRRALSHLMFWHRAGAALGFLLAGVVAFLIVHVLGRIDVVQEFVFGLIDRLPFVTTERRIEVVIFVLGAILLLILTSTAMAIASDIVRWRVLARTNGDDQPVALAEAMKNRLRARSGRLEQQYRFFPKFSENDQLQPNALYVGIGAMAPFWVLMVAFFFYFRW